MTEKMLTLIAIVGILIVTGAFIGVMGGWAIVVVFG